MLTKDHHCLESIIEATDTIIEYTSDINLSDDFKKNHDKMKLIKIKGFRNIVAHDNFGIDAEEVWQIIKK